MSELSTPEDLRVWSERVRDDLDNGRLKKVSPEDITKRIEHLYPHSQEAQEHVSTARIRHHIESDEGAES